MHLQMLVVTRQNNRSSRTELSKGVPQGAILDRWCLTISLGEKYKYADDNSMSHSSLTLQNVLWNLLIDCRIAIEWFCKDGMKATPNKLQFIILPSNL